MRIKRFNNGGKGSYQGVRSSKTPTGNRPVPRVAKSAVPEPSAPGPVKRPITHQPMLSPKTRWSRRGGGPSHGGT